MGDPHLNPAEYDFVAARRRIEGKAKSAAEKLTSLEDAASRVKDGDRIGVGGCLFSRTPLALMREILRQRRRGLTLARNLTCNEGELFMAARAVSRVMTAWMSIGLPWGVSKILRHYVETGAVALEEWSHLALGLRFRAGAMGVPFLPALTMLGSDLVEVGGLKTVQDPYTGETLAAVPALFPDVALVHVPFGSFPHECYGLYEADYDHFAEYCAAIDARGPAAVGDYLERYVYGPPTWSDYLDLFGGERMGLQAKRARELTR